MKNIKIETPRLILREFRDNDISAVLDIIKQPEFSFFAFPPASSPENILKESANRFVNKMQLLQNNDEITGRRENFKAAVCLKENPDKLIGYVAFDEISEAHGEVRDIGYFIHPKHWRKGYATEAAEALMNNVIPELNSDIIWATVHPDNKASQSVLYKLGFRDTGKRKTNSAGEPRFVFNLDRNDFVPQTMLTVPSDRKLSI